MGDQPAVDIGLLSDLQVQVDGTQTRIGRAQWRLEVGRAHLQQAALRADLRGRAHIARHHNFVGDQLEPVGELGAEAGAANRHVFGVAQHHGGLGRAFTNADLAEAVGQRVQVLHGQGHEPRRARLRLVVAKQALGRTAHAHVLACGAHRDAQEARARDFVAAGCKVNVVGHQTNFSAGARRHAARSQRQRGFGARQRHRQAARGRDQAALAPAVAHQAQTVELVDHQIRGGGRVARLQAQLGHLGVKSTHKTLGADAQQAVGGLEVGARDIHRAAGVEREIGGRPVHGHGFEPRVGGRVVQLNAVKLVVEVHRQVAGGSGMLQAHGAQGDVGGAGKSRNAEHIIACAAGHSQRGQAVVRVQQEGVATLAGVHTAGACANDHGVGVGASGHFVVAQAHVHHHRACAAVEAVVAARAGVGHGPSQCAGQGAVVTKEKCALRGTAEELVVASAAGDDGVLELAVNPALRQTTLDQEAVLACTTVEVEHRVHALANVERVVARATVGLDGLDLAAPVVVGLAQRAHDVHVEIAVELNARALVDDFVVIGLAIAAQRIAHVQHQGLALHVRDTRWVCPGPQVAARHGNAHDGHARHQVSTGGCDVDLTAETGQREVDVDEADLELKVQRAPHGRRKARPAAEQQAGACVQVQRA